MILQKVNDLLDRQLREWDMVHRNYDALSRVQTRTLTIGKCAVFLQYNPERIRSSAAKVDAASLKARKCFLCDENQPVEQEKIEWNGKYKIQVNPYPIFPRHLTIACLEHIGQSILGRAGDMLELAGELSDFVLFYNGPKCGASAPDHMHFQAGNKGFMPFVDEYETGKLTTTTFVDGHMDYCGDALCRPFVISAEDAALVVQLFNQLVSLLPVSDGEVEPMMNVLCWKSQATYHLALFPRVKHRPDCYGDGVGQFLLSPASVDMGQAMAVPVERDFNLLNAENVKAMFDELCLDNAGAEQLIENYTKQNNEI